MSARGQVCALTRLEHRSNGHFKFYEVSVIQSSPQGADMPLPYPLPYTVLTEWGRIGARAQSGERKFSVPRAAAKAAQEVVEEKLGKGYGLVIPGPNVAHLPSIAQYHEALRRGGDPDLAAVGPPDADPARPQRNPGEPFGDEDESFFGRLRDEIEQH